MSEEKLCECIGNKYQREWQPPPVKKAALGQMGAHPTV